MLMGRAAKGEETDPAAEMWGWEWGAHGLRPCRRTTPLSCLQPGWEGCPEWQQEGPPLEEKKTKGWM